MKKPTTLDYIILALLQQEAQSGYRIRKTFEETALGNFGTSPGTIYPALKRLTNNLLIEKQMVDLQGKQNFNITNKGKTILKTWLEQTPQTTEIKKDFDILILKFAFMDTLLNRAQKIRFLTVLKEKLEQYIAELSLFYATEKETMPFSAQLSFEHGHMSYETSLKWTKLALERIQKT